MNPGVLIIGAGQAGVQLAASLRSLGYQAPVTLIGAEQHLPYQRPPLSKAYLDAAATAPALALRAAEFYRDQAIDLVRGERITELDLAPDGAGGSARTDTGRLLRFDRLAMTVGARPRRLAVPGADLPGVCRLRDLDDATELRARLDTAERVVVIGGGFIGLEAAAAAATRGRQVTVVEAGPRLAGRALSPLVSDFYRRAHTRRGVTVLLSASVTRIAAARGQVSAVELADGTLLPADLVVVGVGVEPRTELARRIGLACDGGIIVDEYARTSHPAVVAAGDCTVMADPLTGQGRIRLESVPNAIAQSRVAAATVAGQASAYTDVPWFWSDQYDLKLQIAGVTHGYDQEVLRGEPDGERFCALYYRHGRLLGASAVNATVDYLAVRKALATGVPLPAEHAGRPEVALRDLLAAAVPEAA